MTAISFTVPGNPLPKPRPRVTSSGGVYVHQEYKDYERTVADYAAQAMRVAGVEMFSAPVGIYLAFRRKTHRVADIDNLEKAVCDAMNQIVYEDDKLVLAVQKTLARAHPSPGVDIKVMPYADFKDDGHELTLVPEHPTLTVGKFTLLEQGLNIAAAPTLEEFDNFGQVLQFFDKSIPWALGDWWNAAKLKFRDEALQLLDEHAVAVKSVQNKGAVCKAFPPSRRREALHFSHHEAVTGLETVQQERFLDESITRGWTVPQLRLAVRKWKREKLEDELFDDPRAILGHNVEKLREALTDLWGIAHVYPGMDLTLREMQNGIDGLKIFHDAILEAAA